MMGGADRLMYASDYPHPDYDEASTITDLQFLSDTEKRISLAGTRTAVRHMSDRKPVCSEAELQFGDRTIVTIGNVSVGVFNVGGNYYALLNNCSHQNGPVCEGEITREVTAEFDEPGQRVETYYSDTRTIHCPLHAWSFDVATGAHLGNASISIPTFDVEVDDGMIYVRTD